MANFPTIYSDAGDTRAQNPVVGDLSDTLATNPAIRGQFEGGYVATRARFTRMPRTWAVHYTNVLQADKNTIRAFEEARVAGSESFTWTNPEDSVAYTVRFLGVVTYKPLPNSNYKRWDITFTLEEV